MVDGILQGVKVVDLTQYAPGPFATRLLNDLGAEVIKIEPPRGDPMRQMFKNENEEISSVYKQLNRGKKIVKANLKSPNTKKAVANLIANADVLIESFRPGVMERLGLDWKYCKEINPQLIYCSLSGYGQEGPRMDDAGHDINYCAAAGMFSFAKNPTPLFPLIADHSGANNAVTAILAGLVSLSKTGQGRYLDISLYESILSWQYIANASMENKKHVGLEWLTGDAACYNIYRTKDDRHFTLGALESKFWRNFCERVSRFDWIQRQMETLPQTKLIEEVTELAASLNLDEWNQWLESCDCCFEPIPLPEEIYNHPQTIDRKIFGLESSGYPGKISDILRNNEPLLLLQDNQIPSWDN